MVSVLTYRVPELLRSEPLWVARSNWRTKADLNVSNVALVGELEVSK